ncbi:MAG: type II secretion system F family protein [Pseudomonadota bacterium]
MIYFYSLLVFALIFMFLSVIFSSYLKAVKNLKKINSLERKLLWKLPKKYNYSFAFLPELTKKLIIINKNKLIEQELLVLLNNLTSNLTGGISVTETIADSLTKIKPPLKNELSMFLILSKEHSSITALEHVLNKAQNIFLKMFWTALLSHYKNGAALCDNLKKLSRAVYLRINIKERISAQMLNTKIQMIVGTILPYLLFVVMNVLYPYLIKPVVTYSLGITLLITALVIHSFGVYFFSKITKFDPGYELNNALLCEYISLSLRSGSSIMNSLKDIASSGLIKKIFEHEIINSTSTSELISNMEKIKEPFIERITTVLKRGYRMGIPISSELGEMAEDITEKLEQRALRFQQTAPSKALIPLLLCVFPATYLLILTPIIVFTIRQ